MKVTDVIPKMKSQLDDLRTLLQSDEFRKQYDFQQRRLIRGSYQKLVRSVHQFERNFFFLDQQEMNF